MNLIKNAMKDGWVVSEVANVLAHGANDEGRGFLVTLADSAHHMQRECYLPYSIESEALLLHAGLLVAA